MVLYTDGGRFCVGKVSLTNYSKSTKKGYEILFIIKNWIAIQNQND